jgi:hypothetical protein
MANPHTAALSNTLAPLLEALLENVELLLGPRLSASTIAKTCHFSQVADQLLQKRLQNTPKTRLVAAETVRIFQNQSSNSFQKEVSNG